MKLPRGNSTFVFVLLALVGFTPMVSAQEKQSIEYKVKYLRKELANPDDYLRMEAIRKISKLGRGAEEAIPDLIKLAGTEKDFIDASKALVAIGRASIPHLIKAYDDGSRSYPLYAMGELYRAGDTEIKSILLREMRSPLEGMRSRAIRAAADAGRIEEAIPILVELIADSKEDLAIRHVSAGFIGNFGAKAKSAIPLLQSILDDRKNDERLRFSAAASLGGVGRDDRKVFQNLRSVFHDKTEALSVRASAASAIASMQFNQEVMPDFVRSWRDNSCELRSHSLRCISLLKVSNKEIPMLIDILENDEDEIDRESAMIAIGKVGGIAKSVLPKVIQAIPRNLSNGFFRETANALANIVGTTSAVQMLQAEIDELARSEDAEQLAGRMDRYKSVLYHLGK